MSCHQLTEHERYQIYALKKAGHSQKEIATTLGRSPGTISRELRRNSGLRGYRPRQAQRLSEQRRREAYKSIKVNDEVWGWIVEWLQQALSLQQVVAYLRRHKGVSLHHETVYRLIYGDQAEGGELYRHLRILCKPYRKRYGHYARRGRIRHRVDSDDRPAIVDKRSCIVDWEGDTVMGKGGKSA